jgi:hypothetical protein
MPGCYDTHAPMPISEADGLNSRWSTAHRRSSRRSEQRVYEDSTCGHCGKLEGSRSLIHSPACPAVIGR